VAELSDDSEIFHVPCLKNVPAVRSKGGVVQTGGVTHKYSLLRFKRPRRAVSKASDREAYTLDTGCFPGLQGDTADVVMLAPCYCHWPIDMYFPNRAILGPLGTNWPCNRGISNGAVPCALWFVGNCVHLSAAVVCWQLCASQYSCLILHWRPATCGQTSPIAHDVCELFCKALPLSSEVQLPDSLICGG